ncbi:hypothetical protein BJF93_08115 [Xaviernesmea oryzae]|uniref:DUF1902 domain-containing protein n=1 Tax=Xaviernesmea oryzae TaxID=464029 RepID=A0A1Q9B0N8_9HYPH|nr:DUF1902 domain-containing protein [Xaviernesmea oryzae]OLP61573.1 hypothetical protein BJF93_08115 [Xaviernesmea oryzae]SEL07873.1 protein of unknown function [Xaviernesmea oryzae]
MNQSPTGITAVFDAEVRVWVATSEDLDGLAVEADTMEALACKVAAALEDLIALNGFALESWHLCPKETF